MKKSLETKDYKTIYRLLSQNDVFRIILSQSNISGKCLGLLIRNSKNDHDKTGIGYEEKSPKEIKGNFHSFLNRLSIGA